ncbi:DMT family transporter [Culicoidibacter larvae]|uniref:Multidrug efflux SMR transporter n=1 Tax=Culicoidibacter larvae TaxID=2579976 RepID=A0A5R8QHW6_9FIRM|nr:multidrug efflux SMR transporter [Culicoidibacter larvae]TLG77316.1 multidrug efflux SMR transporter [Culicoidibacter larvae]
MSWLLLITAGLFETGFVITLKLSDGFKKLWFSVLTVVCMVCSFWLLSVALETIPLGTGYAIWTGIGALGSVLVGILFFKESARPLKLLCIAMIVAGVVGLKLAS